MVSGISQGIKMKITVVGLGYVGAVTAAGFAQLGHDVVGVDKDKAKLDAIQGGKAPIHEPGLDKTIAEAIQKKKLQATQNLQEGISESEIIFICVGTPEQKDGSTDLKYVKAVAEEIGKIISDNYPVIVVKSTVPPGTTESLIPILEKPNGKKYKQHFGIAMNPEFLREGSAMNDFIHPDKIVLGSEDEKSIEKLKELYSSFKCPLLTANLRTAEMIKYASNAFLATKISFINEMANLCDRLGVDVYTVADAIGHDPRIGRAFLNAGIGYGGSCFPKDVKSLISTTKKAGVEPRILNSVIETNQSQPLRIVEIAKKHLKDLKGKKIAVLGLAFKPDTDDIREAPALKIIAKLLHEGAQVIAYDPKAMENTKKQLGEKISYAKSTGDALDGSDACLLLTEWQEFKKLEAKDFSQMKRKLVIEGRKCLDQAKIKGIEYHGIGRGV